MQYPQIDPIIIRLTDEMAISWYSLAYFSCVMYSMYFAIWVNKKQNLGFEQKFLEDFFGWALIGAIVFARLFYVFFYGWEFYKNDLVGIFRTWEGGLSFHGGLFGVGVAGFLFCKKHTVDFIKAIDLGVAGVPVGLFFGRIANFINGELYGRSTDAKLGMIFPYDSLQVLRHPSQLYEAFFEGFVLYFVMHHLLLKCNKIENRGFLTAFFCIYYGVVRFFIEFFREPDMQVGYVLKYFSMGQVLSVALVVFGFLFYKFVRSEHKNS